MPLFARLPKRGPAFGRPLVAAQMVAAQAGIGVMVLNAARFLATDLVFLCGPF